MRPIITSVYKDNIPTEIRDAQRRVVEAMAPGIDFQQVLAEDLPGRYAHAVGIDRVLAEDTEHDLFLFLDIDAIPLNPKVIPTMLEQASQGVLIAPAQRSNHIENNEHVFAAPCAMAFSRAIFDKVGRPSFDPTPRGDIGEELTYRCEQLGVPVKLLLPTATLGEKIWPLCDGVRYGEGTTYADAIFHAFHIRFGRTQQMFLEKCAGVLATVERTIPEPACHVRARHAERSMVFSADDEPGKPVPELIGLALLAAGRAMKVDFSGLAARTQNNPFLNVWPGEHYKLLAGIVQEVAPKLIVEIGTGTGLSALALRRYLPSMGKIVTFDVVGWKDYPGGVLADVDFLDDRLIQYVADISDPKVFAWHEDIIKDADLIFIDAVKDGAMERRLIELLDRCEFKTTPLVVFDDIRLWNMLEIWRQIDRPKLDVTSFGHWSGTGIVSWTPAVPQKELPRP